LLNTYFSGIGTVDNGRLPAMATIKPSAYKLEQILFTTANITAAIRKLKSNLSSGSDGLSPLLFKRCCDSLAQPLVIMFTQFLSVSYTIQYNTKMISIAP